MSGMFQRIARRQADRSDEPAPVDQAVDQSTADTDTPAAPEPAAADGPIADAAASEPGEGTVEVPAADAPTEQIQAVAPAPSAPPPVMDLTTQLPIATAPVTPTSQSAPAAAPAQPSADGQTVEAERAPRRPGFRARGRMRRRLRYLRKLRELQARDLGGLMFDLRRFERKRDDLVAQKIEQIRACDDELRALERALDERRELRDVREPGIGGTCPRCFAIYGSADKFCASCGAALGGAVQGPAQVPLAPATPAPTSGSVADGPGPQG
jgi:hypothetical protein